MPKRISQLLVFEADGTTPVVDSSGSQDLLSQLDTYPTLKRELEDYAVRSELVARLTPGMSFHREDLLESRQVLRATYDDASFEDWRVSRVESDASGRSPITLRAEPLWEDLLSGSTVRRRLDPDGAITLSIIMTGIEVPDLLTALFSDEYNGPAAIEAGTVDATYQSETPTVQGVGINHQEALEQICAALDAEYEVTWTGSAYAVSVVEEVGDGTINPIDGPTGFAAPSEANRIRMGIRDDARDFFSRVIPLCGSREHPTSIDRATWEITATSGSQLTLDGAPIAYDGFMTGFYFGNETDGYAEVTDSTAPNQITVASAASGAGRFREDATTDLTYLQTGAPSAGFDAAEKVVFFDDIPPDENLFETEGGSPDMSTWSGGLPLGMELVGSATALEATDGLYTAYGTKSVKVTADTDEGIQTIEIPFSPADTRIYASMWSRLKVESGRVEIELEDSAGTVWPTGKKAYTSSFNETELAVGGMEPAAGPVRVRIKASEDGTVFYLDALTLTQTSGPVRYAPDMGPRALFEAGARQLVREGGRQPATYDGELFDAAYLGAHPDEITVGSYAQVRDLHDGTDFQIDATVRVVEVREEENKMDGRIHKRVRLERRRPDLVRRFVDKPPTPTAESAPTEALIQQLEQLEITVSTDTLANVDGDIDGDVDNIPLKPPGLKIDVPAGQDLIIVGAYDALDPESEPEHVMVTLREEALAGDLSLPITQQYVQTADGQPIRADGLSVFSYLYMLPDRIQQGVEEEREGKALTTLSQDVSGTVNQLPVTAPRVDVEDGDQFTLVSQDATYRITLTQDATTSDDHLHIESMSIDAFQGDQVMLDDAYTRSLIQETADEILLRVQRDTWAAVLEADRVLTVDETVAGTVDDIAVTPAETAFYTNDKLVAVHLDTGDSYELGLRNDLGVGETDLDFGSTYVDLEVGDPIYLKSDYVRETLHTQAASITINADNITSLVSDVNTLDGRVTTAESSIAQNSDAINATVSMITGAQVAEMAGFSDYDGTQRQWLYVTGITDPLEAGDTVVLIRESDGQRTELVLTQDLATTDNQIYFEQTAVYGDVGDPIVPGSVVGLRLDMDGIEVQSDVFKSSNYTPGTQGWALFGDGSAELTGTLRAAAGDVVIGDDGIELPAVNVYDTVSAIEWTQNGVRLADVWAEGISSSGQDSGTINLRGDRVDVLATLSANDQTWYSGSTGGAELDGSNGNYELAVYGSDGDGEGRIEARAGGQDDDHGVLRARGVGTGHGKVVGDRFYFSSETDGYLYVQSGQLWFKRPGGSATQLS